MSPATIIVAASLSNGIGVVHGASAILPWRLPKEIAFFAQVTSWAADGQRNKVIMGRRTWDSIPARFKPLKDRLNVILSRDTNLSSQEIQSDNHSILWRTCMADAVKEEIQNSVQPATFRTFIIGGAAVYEEALKARQDTADSSSANFSVVDRILMTRILSPSFDECNVMFPEFRTVADESQVGRWAQSTHEEYEAWIGLPVPRGVQREKHVEYEFQMWVRQQ